MPTLETERISSVGTLSDSDIESLCSESLLIASNYCPSCIKQCCYELRASSTYYELNNGKKRYDLAETNYDYILIKPKHTVVIITLEELHLPNNILGRVLTKGKLFSIGLQPVNTYADPGFSGNMGIVFYNTSNRFIKIYPGEPICKIEFSRLQKPIVRLYDGQHGYRTNIWPIPENMFLSTEEIQEDERISTITDEIISSYGKDFGTVVERIFKYEKLLIIASILSLLSIAILLFFAYHSESIMLSGVLFGVLFGVLANFITTLTVHFASNIRRS